ncbi:PLP-dependent aminotransferase family protein [Bradyrhizobium sp. Pear76]|uniref:MocR-like pyridoxine biosynthesis transcription factor PdxR n=1 Tax=Bradyrhizobium oropedii TaxID=1571201 RepID=UPI001E520E8E|nr:PLP-dependent aminotransferase family protein [Bradyrhizobium oropedii]MCC8964132.1 PLP-dependent aminotransferase family protein [Bradyrhizobium oropedii]
MTRRRNKPAARLVRSGGTPLSRQLYERFRSAIATGQLRPGDRLPSIRGLAEELAMARGTVDAAYGMLAGEGYVVTRGQAGTIVSPELRNAEALEDVATLRARSTGRPSGRAEPLLLQMGLPAVDLFPRKLWSHLIAREARRSPASDMMYPDPAGFGPLRQAIAAYLASSRGIACDWRQVLVTNGFQGGLDLSLRILLRRGDRAWIEDPCFPPVRAALELARAELVAVPIDSEGMRVGEGIRQARRARLAVVTPSHQSPLGVSLSLPRRMELLRWANLANAYVIEDDYDSEFRFVGRPLPALKSLDRGQRVIYSGTFSKTLFPGLRLGYLVLPDRLLDTFTEVTAGHSSGLNPFAQRVVAGFMAEGHFARHLKRMRKLYAARRAALAGALKTEFGERVRIELQPGGMHLLLRCAGRTQDARLAQLARADGFGAEPLSNRSVQHDCGQGLLVGFTNVAEADAPAIAKRLRRAIEPVTERRARTD